MTKVFLFLFLFSISSFSIGRKEAPSSIPCRSILLPMLSLETWESIHEIDRKDLKLDPIVDAEYQRRHKAMPGKGKYFKRINKRDSEEYDVFVKHLTDFKNPEESTVLQQVLWTKKLEELNVGPKCYGVVSEPVKGPGVILQQGEAKPKAAMGYDRAIVMEYLEGLNFDGYSLPKDFKSTPAMITEMERIRDVFAAEKIETGDLHFLINPNTGRVYVVDPSRYNEKRKMFTLVKQPALTSKTFESAIKLLKTRL